MTFLDTVKEIRETFKEDNRPTFDSFVNKRLEITREQYNKLVIRTLDFMNHGTPDCILRVVCRKYLAKETKRKLYKERLKNKKLEKMKKEK